MGLRRKILFPIGLLVGVALLLLSHSAAAHAVLLDSSPAIDSTVAGPDVPIKLHFNVRIDAVRSRLTLVKPDASVDTLPIAKDSPANVLLSQARGLHPGAYRIRWQALASDGHITRGEIPFRIKQS